MRIREDGLRLQRGPQGEHPQSHLRGFAGLLQVDGYAGFGRLVAGNADNAPQLAFCWAHVRRKFYDIHVATQSPLADEALRRIAQLYEIEASIRATPADNRRSVRQMHSRPLVEAMRTMVDSNSLVASPVVPPSLRRSAMP